MSDTHTEQPPPEAGALARREGPQGLEAARQSTVSLALAGLVPGTIGEASQLSQALARSRAIPSAYRNAPDTVLTAILAGIEIGLTPIRALNSFVVISGNLTMKADLMLALARRSQMLDFYAEGFERWQKTDEKLAERLTARAIGWGVEPEAAKVWATGIAEEIRAQAGYGMDPGKDYGWCVLRRKGDGDTIRTFSWFDADRIKVKRKEKRQVRPGGGVEVEEEDDDADDGSSSKGAYMSLHEKHNYRHYPGDMYPKRARGRAINQALADVMAGIPSTESMEYGQVIEGEVVRSHLAEVVSDVDGLIDEMVGNDPEAAGRIVAGFEQLDMNEAARLQRLRQFQGEPAKLLEWLKAEYLQRQGRPVTKPEPTARSTARESSRKPKPKARGRVEKPASTKPAETKPAESKQEAPGVAGQVAAAVDAVGKAMEKQGAKPVEPTKPGTVESF